jgi:hypothetical protein
VAVGGDCEALKVGDREGYSVDAKVNEEDNASN